MANNLSPEVNWMLQLSQPLPECNQGTLGQSIYPNRIHMRGQLQHIATLSSAHLFTRIETIAHGLTEVIRVKPQTIMLWCGSPTRRSHNVSRLNNAVPQQLTITISAVAKTPFMTLFHSYMYYMPSAILLRGLPRCFRDHSFSFCG